MASKRKAGRAAAEAAYADLLKENTSLVGDVGEAFDDLVAKLDDATHARDRYEDARAAAVKGGAVTNEQLEQMGYKKTPKLPAPPPRVAAGSPGVAEQAASSLSEDATGAEPREPALAAAGTQSESNSHE
ncbi:hypothetical protein [Mycobacterium sp.]|uniref:hypothetical protein n=1 Tax=Mycobacterium sp. TaxID=1785 RepID=UPI0025EC0D25|nr:hypothetical protein [Mycobacterium sp.]